MKKWRVFERASIGNVVLRNRFVRSATGERLSTKEGHCTPDLIKVIRGLAEGGAGLIIPGHASVTLAGRSDNRQMSIHDDSTLPGLGRLCEAAHENGAAIFVQLTHAGAKADPGSGFVPKSSYAHVTPRGLKIEAMTHEDIAELVTAFASAAARAKKAGFDGVQIHLGHGYGLCQFVSPFLNRRTDEYGGSLKNRARIALEVYRAIREAVGSDYPVITKMNCDDFIDGGTDPAMMLEMASMLANEGLSAVEMSGGIGHPMARFSGARNYDPKDEAEEAYYRRAAAMFKRRLDIPLLLVGGIRRLETAEKLVEEGVTDFISLCRPLIREADLISRWQRGEEERALCVSCNGCSKAIPEGRGIRCIFEEDREE